MKHPSKEWFQLLVKIYKQNIKIKEKIKPTKVK